MQNVFEITKSDVMNGLVYAAQSLNFTYNRMNYSKDDPDAELKRFKRIRNGIIIEQACERILSKDFAIPLISSPFRTDYRTTDSSELILASAKGAMLPVDIKGFHIYREFNREVRTPEMLVERGYALVPQDQYHTSSKPVYIFPFLIADEHQENFFFNNRVEIREPVIIGEKKVPEYHRTISIGISFAKNSGKVSSRIFQISNPTQIKLIDADIEELDCVFGFDEEIQSYNLYIDERENGNIIRTLFIDKQNWQRKSLGIANASLLIAGWAMEEDVKHWDKIATGATDVFPYYKTYTHNYGCRITELRPIETLSEYLSSI